MRIASSPSMMMSVVSGTRASQDAMSQAAQTITSGNMDALAEGVAGLILAKNQMAAMSAVAKVDAEISRSTIDMLI